MAESATPTSGSAGLSLDEVRHIATLARIGMTDEDLDRFQTDLSAILSHFDTLDGINTDGEEPTAGGTDLLNVLAEDEPRPSLPQKDVLANAPRQEEGLIRVKAVLD